ncbi:hypothetical protein Dfer_3326 [Dyadobacter fermentans DSM 18053]|uniref:Uncharacterized protein n=1 Tax=Dyadobacter fermentans (strain ATCC 700827 / DSM 18053 / CIP 107007 / KCTC 52180 / NS114) TaxID=471854 RepID=C6VS16_DYAFD|nr:hypothetical protein Dfer_3326 [Dyadobacter fermentans DSM 18053]
MDINDFFENYIDEKGLFNDSEEDLENVFVLTSEKNTPTAL